MKGKELNRVLRGVAVGLVGVFSLSGCQQQDAEAAASVGLAAPALLPGQVQLAAASLAFVTVETLGAQAESNTRQVWAPARMEIHDDQLHDVQAPVAGRISAVHVRPGDSVTKGAPIATLISPDASAIRLEYDNARIEWNIATLEAKRQQQMLDKGVGVAVEKELAEAQLQQATRALENARRAIAFLGEGKHDQVILRAPVDGTVIERTVSAGAEVDPSRDPLFRIGNPGALRVVAELPERLLSSVKPGAAVSIQVSTQATLLTGNIERVNRVLNRETHRGQVFINLDEDNATLSPGMLARAAITIDGDNTLSIPLSAVLIKNDNHSVVYVQTGEGLFEARDVSLGQPANGQIAVLDGLKTGERIVVSGGLLLDGAASQILF